ncbi:MAG: EFR1 family ferrodoxin [Duncaniella sp.]|nr:EFR1 family ferrodoxin [Duncaniella sp.]
MILYFSGTGNSRYVAERLGALLGDKVVPMFPDKKPAMLADDNRLIWVFPIYSWGVPPIVRRVISTLTITDRPTIDCYMVATCGDDIGHANRMWRRDISRRGWTPVATYSVQMPNNYVCMKGFDVDAPETAESKIAASRQRIAAIAYRIKSRTETDDAVTGSWPWIKTAIIYPWFVRNAMSPRKFRWTEDCISCGKCAHVCPLRNITMDSDNHPSWGDNCAFCLACYHICPRHAVAYSNATKDKGQYFFNK